MAVFRAVFGLIIIWEVIKYFDRGYVNELWVNPAVRFSYLGFGWVRPWPIGGLHLHWGMMGVAAAGVALGFWYRWSAWVLAGSFTYFFLLEATRYLNHFYAACLFALLLACNPGAAVWSIDAWRKGDVHSGMVPVWAVWLLRFQVGIIYLYGGLAKLQGDWLQGYPIGEWMRKRTHLPLVDFIVGMGMEVPFFGWGGAAFDVLVVPGLLWRRTRPYAFVGAVVFHLLNAHLFAIGIFPWMMIGATTIFFAPHWPRYAWNLATGSHDCRRTATANASRPLSIWAAGLIGTYVVFQSLWPARDRLYAGNVLWTEEGLTFSWRMMLRDKQGETQMRVVTDAAVDTVRLDEYLSPWQLHAVATRPFHTLQFAHFLAREYERSGHRSVRVYADSWMSLNGRPKQLMIDPNVDLAQQPITIAAAKWIVPLREFDR